MQSLLQLIHFRQVFSSVAFFKRHIAIISQYCFLMFSSEISRNSSCWHCSMSSKRYLTPLFMLWFSDTFNHFKFCDTFFRDGIITLKPCLILLWLRSSFSSVVIYSIISAKSMQASSPQKLPLNQSSHNRIGLLRTQVPCLVACRVADRRSYLRHRATNIELLWPSSQLFKLSIFKQSRVLK